MTVRLYLGLAAFVALSAIGLRLGSSLAAGPSQPSELSELPPPWALRTDATIPLSLPPDVRADVELALDYESTDTIRGVQMDLNGDGATDYIVQSSPRLCGTGGCMFDIVDGKRRTVIAELLANPLYVLAKRSHGYPVVESYSSLSAWSADWTRLEFDGTAYRVTANRELTGSALDSTTNALRQIPRWSAASRH